MEQVVILYSGGADSRLMLELAKDLKLEPTCILVDYGQLHKEELELAVKILKQKIIKYKVVKIEGYDVKSALTTGEKGLYKNVSQWNVPNRNMLLLSIACGFAESEGISKVWYGADFSDRQGCFLDCYQEWVLKLNELLKITTSNSIQVYAPLLGLTKQDVLDLLNADGIFKDEYFSGYGDL